MMLSMARLKRFLQRYYAIIAFFLTAIIVATFMDPVLESMTREELLTLSRLLIAVFFVAIELHLIVDLINKMVNDE